MIASILIAFALDAWWDGRQEAESLEEALHGVRTELLSNRDLLTREMGTLNRITGASAVLLERMTAGEAQASIVIEDSIGFLASNWAPSLEVSLGAVDALIASGRLAEIEDPRLRLGLAGLRDRFSDVVEDELVARKVHTEQQGPTLGRLIETSVFLRLNDDFFSGADVALTPVPHFGQIRYPNTRELRSIIYRKISWYGSALGEMRALIDHIDDLVALTEREAGLPAAF